MIAAPAKDGNGVAATLATVLAGGDGHLSARARKAFGWYVTGAAAVTLGRQAWSRALGELVFTVTVESDDDIYADLQAWVLARVPADRQRSLRAVSGRAGQDVPAPAAGMGEKPRALRLFYDGRRTQTVNVHGHRVRVMVEREEINSGQNNQQSWSWRRDKVVFTARGVAARDAVLTVLRGLADARNARPQVRCYVGRTWGDWQRAADVQLRPLTSVVLRHGQGEGIVEDMARFLADEERYVGLGLPWHRGYLFEGPAGTGKTSFAKALAERYGMDVYYVPLASIQNDSALLSLFGNVPSRSVLLLEDVDIVHGFVQRDDSEPGVSMSGLLNGLDGILTPHGLVTVVTTNHAEVIDSALLRRGRIDKRIHFDYLDDEQLARLVAFALRRPAPPLPPVPAHLTPADVLETLKPHLDDPEAGVRALEALLMEPSRDGALASRA